MTTIMIQLTEVGPVNIKSEQLPPLYAHGPELLLLLREAAERIRLANAEGNPILSAWLSSADAAIAKTEGR